MNFCTYFDINYLPKGACCHKTLCGFGDHKLFVVCLDDTTFNVVSSWNNVVPIRLADVESWDNEYLKTKSSRSLTAYYITMSPILPLYIFEKFGVDLVFYTDADMAFWSDPIEIYSIMGDRSLMVTDQGFEPPRGGIRFNNGIMGYRNDEHCRAFLAWWRDRCLEWCNWSTTRDGKCGEQGYLNIICDQPGKFKNTLVCPQPGINMGPWNVAKYDVRVEKGVIRVFDGHSEFNLVCYHYHEFRYLSDTSYHPTGWKHTEEHRRLIYDPYFALIRQTRKELGHNRVDFTNIGK